MITNATSPLTKKTLFDTTTLRRHTLKNRIWRSATWLALADNEGNVTDEIVRTYEELAALVDVPVVLVGGLRSVEKINQYLDEAKIDLRKK